MFFKKKRRSFRVRLILLLALALTIVIISPGYMTLEYIKRCIVWGQSDIKDYERFPFREVQNSDTIFRFNTVTNNNEFLTKVNNISYKQDGKSKTIENIDQFLEKNDTTAFIIIQNDTILYENYFNGYSRDSINTSFSMAKSFVSALIGIAIDEGYIDSVDDPITNYIPELRSKGFEHITIKHLLTMSSGIKYVEGRLLWGDDAKTYYPDNLRNVALNEVEIVEKSGQVFLYNNYHPLLLGLILERATHVPVSQYLQEKIWKPLEMEFPASWSMDSEESGFEKMESGINARSIDFAKFGRLFLSKGNWNGKQVISEDWVLESTQPDLTQNKEYYKNAWFETENVFYKYLWYSYPREEGVYDFIAVGHLSQYIYVSPSKNLIIVRNGSDDGDIDSWIELFYNIATAL